jgi:hypothetical protein
MPDEFIFSVEACFADSRPVLDVKYDVEKRVKRLLPRDPERLDALLFRGTSASVTTGGTSTIELRLEAAFDTHNLYALRLEYTGPGSPMNEKTWSENVRGTMDRWTESLMLSESRVGASSDRFHQVVEETTSRERELANQPPREEDLAAISAIQQGILDQLRQGKYFFTANKEGGTHIKLIGGRFVFQDYGESDDREEFSTEAEFFERLRKFYDSPARYDWLPHTPREIEVWRFIDRELGS